MVVVFALLVLAVIVAGLLVFVRYPTAAQVDDGTPVDAMHWRAGAITAGDLQGVRFPVVMRGYRMADVDALTAALAAQLAEGESRNLANDERGDIQPPHPAAQLAEGDIQAPHPIVEDRGQS